MNFIEHEIDGVIWLEPICDICKNPCSCVDKHRFTNTIGGSWGFLPSNCYNSEYMCFECQNKINRKIARVKEEIQELDKIMRKFNGR